MPFSFTCPHCGHETTVGDEYAGMSGPCSRCGKTITMPAASMPTRGAPAKQSSGFGCVLVLLVGFVVAVIVIGILIALLLPAVTSARGAARRMQCTNNLKVLAIAMHNYHDQHKTFPPAYIPDENGDPMHSWRVLMLPYIEEQWLYNQYDFDEPWDGPNNSLLHNEIVSAFRCPSSEDGDPTSTSYVMIVGPDTISDGPNGSPIGTITDGTSNTIMLVEVPDSGVHWLEPRDMPVSNLDGGVAAGPAAGGLLMGSRHEGGCNVAMCDGSVHFMSESTPTQQLKALATKNDGERIRP